VPQDFRNFDQSVEVFARELILKSNMVEYFKEGDRSVVDDVKVHGEDDYLKAQDEELKQILDSPKEGRAQKVIGTHS
jgi:hypothetical protein